MTLPATVHRYDSLEAIANLAEAWNQLASGHAMRSYEWHSCWWSHYGQQELCVLTVVDADGTLIGVAPWRIERSTRQGSVLHWLGDGEVCTDHTTVLARPGREDVVAQALADYLVDMQDWDLLQLDDIDADDPIIEKLISSLRDQDCRTHAQPAGACWAIGLPEDWETFLARQSKSHRKQLRRAERRVLESDACQWHSVASADQWQQAWPLFIDLHQRRRQSLGEPGCFASPRFEAFHTELSQRLLHKGLLRLSWLELHGKPAAAEYHFAGSGSLLAYQGGVDPDMLDDEPGRLSMIATLKAALEEGVATYDLLRGDEPYKAHWRAEPHATVHARIVPPRRTARVRDNASRLVGAVRTGVRSLRGKLS